MLSSPWGEMTCDSLAGLCRRVDSLLAAVLQRCKNHDTFEVVRVSVDERPDLADRFRVDAVPTLLVVEERQIRTRVVQPRSAVELMNRLGPWLRRA
jgi:thioredoxin-like negative regulator of GroEL